MVTNFDCKISFALFCHLGLLTPCRETFAPLEPLSTLALLAQYTAWYVVSQAGSPANDM